MTRQVDSDDRRGGRQFSELCVPVPAVARPAMHEDEGWRSLAVSFIGDPCAVRRCCEGRHV